MARKVSIPANLPADAFGFIAVRHDRPERRALYTRDGLVAATFAQDATDTEISASLAAGNLRVESCIVFGA